MQSIQIGKSLINYKTIRTGRKTLGINIDPEKGVIVRSPKSLSDNKIEDMIRKKASWILEKLDRVKEIKPKPTPKEYLSGEKLLYIGRRYRIQVEPDDIKKTSIKLYQGHFYIKYPNHKDRIKSIKPALEDWYRQHAKSKFLERINKYKKTLGLEPNNVIIKAQKKRWGSCSSRNNINLNYRLIMAPMSVIDYIIVHELTHLKYPDHSNEFWNLLETVIPNYEEKQEWLRINGNRLIII